MATSISSRIREAQRRLDRVPHHLDLMQHSESPQLPEVLKLMEALEQTIAGLEGCVQRSHS